MGRLCLMPDLTIKAFDYALTCLLENRANSPLFTRMVSTLSDANRRLQWKAKAFFRRRLSELRDNQLSKNPELLSVAKALQRYLLKNRSHD